MITRRQFLKLSATQVSLLGLPRSMAPDYVQPLSQTVIQLFSSYASKVGIRAIEALTDTPEARQERQRVNTLLAQRGFTLDETGRSYQDYEMASDLSRYRMMCIEHYLITHRNRMDVVVPLFPDFSDSLKPLFGTASIIGAAFAVADYARQFPRHTMFGIASAFFPISQLNEKQIEIAIFENPLPSTAVYETRNGELAIAYQPATSQSSAYVSVTTQGKIDFFNEYPLEIRSL